MDNYYSKYSSINQYLITKFPSNSFSTEVWIWIGKPVKENHQALKFNFF
jgi:hypothetical protein